ncbi:hypothetical protein GYMLUDRAFT_52998 [Collybiopsis luxurians FD-317 M1]|nr:hypothetical protein GYMLUDRAFT_52998 [Collybiopsis luxurians FD-317 M1]
MSIYIPGWQELLHCMQRVPECLTFEPAANPVSSSTAPSVIVDLPPSSPIQIVRLHFPPVPSSPSVMDSISVLSTLKPLDAVLSPPPLSNISIAIDASILVSPLKHPAANVLEASPIHSHCCCHNMTFALGQAQFDVTDTIPSPNMDVMPSIAQPSPF